MTRRGNPTTRRAERLLAPGGGSKEIHTRGASGSTTTATMPQPHRRLYSHVGRPVGRLTPLRPLGCAYAPQTMSVSEHS
ncbi:unnamed protein product, partial [Nesidiocoris tenuis]